MRKRALSILLPSVLLGILGLATGMARPAERDNKDVDEYKLIGTWKLVTAKYDGQDVVLDQLGTTLKHVTPTSFVWLSYDPETNLVSRMAGGTYTLKGDQYIETPQYGVGADFNVIRDKPQSFSFKIDGEKWHHSGALSSGVKIEEVWERSKKQ
jgi:hypothetical protein